jgi:hypothetical protein
MLSFIAALRLGLTPQAGKVAQQEYESPLPRSPRRTESSGLSRGAPGPGPERTTSRAQLDSARFGAQPFPGEDGESTRPKSRLRRLPMRSVIRWPSRLSGPSRRVNHFSEDWSSSPVPDERQASAPNGGPNPQGELTVRRVGPKCPSRGWLFDNSAIPGAAKPTPPPTGPMLGSSPLGSVSRPSSPVDPSLSGAGAAQGKAAATGRLLTRPLT